MSFRDRSDAGSRLANRTLHLRGEDVVVLALPRGGVPVAVEVARALGAPLDVIVVRKLGVPVQPETADELRFGEALDAVLRQLALLVVRDGEGARRIGRVVVRGGDADIVHGVARAVADSSLVKTALYGGDPNWGRIVQAVGMATAGMAPLALDIAIEGVQVCARGAYAPHDADGLKAAVQREEVEYEIGLPGEGAETELFFSDLGHEYVTINADYMT